MQSPVPLVTQESANVAPQHLSHSKEYLMMPLIINLETVGRQELWDHDGVGADVGDYDQDVLDKFQVF